MPNRKTHVKAGIVVGASAAAYRASEQSPLHALLETLGGAMGGWAGGITPDFLEPASGGSYHRSFCHSWTALVTGVKGSAASVSAWEKYCRGKANEAAQMRLNPQVDPTVSFILFLMEMIWRITAGICAGFLAGYGSHLVLDSFTPRSLPIFA